MLSYIWTVGKQLNCVLLQKTRSEQFFFQQVMLLLFLEQPPGKQVFTPHKISSNALIQNENFREITQNG